MKIDKEEKKLIESIENGEWRPVRDSMGLRKKVLAAVKTTMLKDQRMNIRIARRDLEALKARALEEGMPYQSLVSSVLHRYVTGRLVESRK
ncbi:MAG: antitoxin [Nitrospirae bacterium]|nr:MAG: antitoxin [Nitrospirota bacterium]